MSDSINKLATKAGFWYIIGNLLLKGVVFFSLPIFTRILSTSDFGIYNAYMAYEGIIAAIVGLGIYGSIKNAKFDFKYNFEEYISSSLFLSMCVFATITVLINVLYPVIADILGFSRFITNCLLFQSFGASFIQFYGAKLNIEFKYKSYLMISIFNSIGSVLLSVLLILFVFPHERYVGRILGSMIPPVLVLLFVGGYIIKKEKCLYNRNYWKYVKLVSLPLVPHVVSQSILSQFDRIMIRDMIGASEAGIYSYMYTICTITYVICISLDNAWTPWLFYKINEHEEREIKEASSKYVDLFAFITIAFVCVMPEVAKILAASDYWSGLDLLMPLSLANFSIFLYFMPVSLEYYNKKTSLISLGTIAAAITNLVLNYVAIQMFGYKAAAYTTAISYFLLFIFHSIISMRFGYSKIFNLRHIFKRLILVFFSIVIFGAIYRFAYLSLVMRYFALILLIVFVYKNRKFYVLFLRRKT